MTNERKSVQHKLQEAVPGERIVKALEAIAVKLQEVQFSSTPLTTYNASSPDKVIKTFRDALIVWTGVKAFVGPTTNGQYEASIQYNQVIFEFERELTEEEKQNFRTLLNRLDEAIMEKPDLRAALEVKTKQAPEDTVVKATPEVVEFSEKRKYRILALIHGEFGKRKVKTLKERGPRYWVVESIELPLDLPELIDDPEEFLPEEVSEADIVLALQENANASQLIVDFVRLSGAKALLAPIDNSEWLPEGQKNQVQRQLKSMGIESSFPRPFCVFEEVGDPYLDEFAKYFGRPIFRLSWERDNVTEVEVLRGSPCGCSDFVAEKLRGVRVDEASDIAGLAHHHYPCLAAMVREPDIDDTLMHKSGFMTKDAVDREIQPYKKKHTSYLDPSGLK